MKKILLILLVFSVIVFSTSAFADDQVPGIVAVVEGDPYYFSEGDFGIKILKFFERSLEPYLVPGKTTEKSSIEDISAEYQISTEHILQKTIVPERERAIVFVIHFSNGDIPETQTYKTFLKFTHSEDIPKYSGPSSYQLISYGLELESLPSIDKQWFYDNIISRSINIGKKPQPFDIDVDILTGDSHILQTWQYRKCEVVEYTPFLDENLARLKFVGDFVSEIRERVVFGCDGFHVDFEMKVPFTIPKTTIKSANFVPDKTDRAEQILVQFSGGELELEKPLYSFSKFMPVTQRGTAPILSPGYTIGATPQFTLESLPSKDKTEYYQALSRYILPGKDPEPFDTTIHLVTGSGEILQTWKYTKCSATNYVTFFLDNLLFFKFKQTSGSEIRDKTYFECTGLVFDPVELGEKQKEITGIFVPDDNQRAQTFVVHFQGTDIAPPKTVTSFTKFSPITNEELPILLPGAPFGEEPKFYLESLPSIENEWYYQLMSRYINRGAIPELFAVTVDVLSGDGTTIQTWQYRKCEVLEYKPFLEDILVKQKFTKKLQPEIRDRTIFECDGFSVDGNLYSPESVPQKTLDYVDFIPSDENRAQRFMVTLSGGEFSTPTSFHTFAKFDPIIEQRGDTVVSFVELDVTVIQTGDEPQAVSTVTTTNSKSIDPYASVLHECPPNSQNPNCEPEPNCPPTSQAPECQEEEEPGQITEPEPEPGVPEITQPTYYVSVTEPHLSTIKVNDFQGSSGFTLQSLSSKDKEQFYKLISRYFGSEKTPEPFDVTIDIVTGDGKVLQSWEYRKCGLDDFDTYLQDNLLYFTMSGKPATSEIRDKSTFECVGFSVNFDLHESEYDSDVVTIPKDQDRAMLYLMHGYDGELKTQRSTALAQKINTLDESNILVSGLPNIYTKDLYKFVSRYMNPGKTPDPIDFRFDVLTGDGTVLYSAAYSGCRFTDVATYLNDNLIFIKHFPSLKSEIRVQAVIDCVGMDLLVTPQKDPFFDLTGNLKKISPLIQRAIGVPSNEVVCNDNFELMIRPPKDVAVCIKTEHVSKFEERGWKIPSSTSNKVFSDTLQPIVPTDEERAMSFLVHFQGTDIAPPKTVDTFSKFVPITDAKSLFLRPSNPLDTGIKEFYLESLPSKDKDWFYELLSRYMTPGKIPEPFKVKVEVITGTGEILQIWDYSSCERTNYEIFLDENVLTYKFHKKWQSEIKDRTFFSCAGLHLNYI